ncbi:hypothetical protein TraAM80_09098 [Trypanosoma rangeli]|uniref:J domain-containing protein n=1 Tax=Trypanosoma rangeli TaxID=5698 RepID=A0A422MXB6_TRYRA|nr:uncharacterized protein TraAM80_09098 [Trypanosoma rangeli]RNE97868.1 hypothetical protein TraAM80_09098 [Trypanosoma rangeli]|eukprot:RNE97868.1 hypothetical protein TraAM80_09098 [Trypanosoma rangeli]
MFYSRIAILRVAASSSSSRVAGSAHASPASPHEVLGVAASAPFEEIKARYQELTRYYHPDMPHGDPAKFREINTAYRALRAAWREKKADKIDPESFWSERNRRSRDDYTSSQSHRRGRRDDYAKKNRSGSLLREMLWMYESYELVIVLGAAVAVLLVATERYVVVLRMTREKRARLRAMDEGFPPIMPLVVDDEMLHKYNEHVPKEEIEVDDALLKEEAYHRRATQRRFEDFREFLYIYNPEGVTSRKVTTKRFSIQYIDEALIPKRCTHVWEFNSEQRNKQYETIVREVEKTLGATPWATPDVQYIAPLVAKGLALIPMNSPHTAKWTFLEYKDMDKDGESSCLMALKNNRFGRLGMCQQVTVTGSNELSPKLVKKQEAELQSGALKKESLIHGGKLPVKDLSIPLEHMKL